jgi:hypothetical protein
MENFQETRRGKGNFLRYKVAYLVKAYDIPSNLIVNPSNSFYFLDQTLQLLTKLEKSISQKIKV